MPAVARSHRITAPLLLALMVSGCDGSTTLVESGPIEGVWVANATNGALFLVITSDSLVYYTALDAEDCADRFAYSLTPVGGNDYLLESSVSFVLIQSTITQVDDELTWRTAIGSGIFTRSSVDPADLTVCAGGGDDPSLSCASLPALQLDQEQTGALEDGDGVERSRYFDVYSFQPADPLDPAEITLTAIGFDAYLYLYDAGGALIAENDDGIEGSTSARLTLPLDPACYRVEVTTAYQGTGGAYSLRVR